MPGSSWWHHGMRSCYPSTTWVLWSWSAPGSCRGRNGGLEHLCDFIGRWRGSYASKSLLVSANWINYFICGPSPELWTEWGSLFAGENAIWCCPETLCQESNLELCHFRGIWTSLGFGFCLVGLFVCLFICFKRGTFRTNCKNSACDKKLYFFSFLNSWICEEFWWPPCNCTDWNSKKYFEMVTEFELSTDATHHDTTSQKVP